MSKKSIARLIRIASEAFGTGKDDTSALETNLTRFEKFVHFWVLVWRSFARNRCPVRASALSYITLLAMIPMLAVAMSVSSAFLKAQSEDQIENFIQQFVDNMIPAATALDFDESNLEMGFDPAVTNSVSEAASTNTVAGVSNTNTTPAVVIDTTGKEKKNLAKVAAEYISRFDKKTYSTTMGVTGLIFLMMTAVLTLTRV